MLHLATEALLVLMLCTFVKTTDICLQASWDNYTDGQKLPEFPIKIIEKIGLQSCYRECQAHGNCFSVNFNRNEFMCQLINEKASHLKPLFDDENFVYMEITDTVSISEITCLFRNSKHIVREVRLTSNVYVYHVSMIIFMKSI